MPHFADAFACRFLAFCALLERPIDVVVVRPRTNRSAPRVALGRQRGWLAKFVDM